MAQTRPLPASAVPVHDGSSYPDPLKAPAGQRERRRLGDAFGLTQIGVNLETLLPGGRSALRHWHTLEDEFVHVLDGELVLRTNAGETRLAAGMCIGFPAGVRDGHQLVNRSSHPATYLVMSNRAPGDNAFYPDDDLMWCENEDGVYPAHKDGTPYRLPQKKP